MGVGQTGEGGAKEAGQVYARPMKKVSVVYNPIKVPNLEERVAVAAQLAGEFGYAAPDWIETSVDDPGEAMGRQALESGAELVIAMGGDGTVRYVAAALKNQGVPMAIVPQGTGNLLARNLDIPLTDYEAQLRIAYGNTERTLDVGTVEFDDRKPETFLVIAGAGLDADTMANTSDNLKKLVGWVAYVEGGARAMLARGFRVRVENDEPGPDGHEHHARSYMVCNCGILQAGVVLVPEAEPDDGHMDTLVLSPRGPRGWAALVTDIVTRHRRGHRQMRHWITHEATASFNREVEGQVDGDAIGPTRRMKTSMDTQSLLVRVPA